MQSFEERSVQGKTILLTGASRGIGAFVAKELAKRGANLILVSRDQKALDGFVSSLKQETNNPTIAGFACNIGDVKAVNAMFDQHIVTNYSHIDIVINNAGVMPGFSVDPELVSDDLDIETLRTNVDGYWFVTKRCLPLLFKSPSGFERTIVFVSSASSWLEEPEPGFGMIAYRASKAAENGMMVGLHKCYVEDSPITQGVRGNKNLHRVVSIHPGFVQTGLGRETWQDKSASDEQIEKAKVNFGAIPIEQGCDTLLWTVLSQDKAVQSGKHYYERKVHSF